MTKRRTLAGKSRVAVPVGVTVGAAVVGVTSAAVVGVTSAAAVGVTSAAAVGMGSKGASVARSGSSLRSRKTPMTATKAMKKKTAVLKRIFRMLSLSD